MCSLQWATPLWVLLLAQEMERQTAHSRVNTTKSWRELAGNGPQLMQSPNNSAWPTPLHASTNKGPITGLITPLLTNDKGGNKCWQLVNLSAARGNPFSPLSHSHNHSLAGGEMACSQNNNGLHAIPEPRTVFMVCQMKSINIVASALAPMSVSFQQRSQEVAV